MRRFYPIFAAALCLIGAGESPARQPAAGGSAGAPPAAPAPISRPPTLTPGQAAAMKGLAAYLSQDEIPDTYEILPPAPKGASGARREDIAAYRETRKLKGGPRWRLAADDAVLNPFSLLDDLTCALGGHFDETNAPALVRLLGRVGRDSSHIVNKAKDQFKQLRPFVALGGPICTEGDRRELADSYSYPSGHSTYSWAVALTLAELAPDRATAILARARAFGESRVVCGVHWVSDVEEGRTNAAILVAVLHSNQQFMADMAMARREVAAASGAGAPPAQGGPTSGMCAAKAVLAGPTPWTR